MRKNNAPYMFMKDIKTSTDTVIGRKRANEEMIEMVGMCLLTLIILSLIILAYSVTNKVPTPSIETIDTIIQKQTKLSKLTTALEGKVEP